MYNYIRGELTGADLGKVVVEAGGIGYQVLIPINVALPELGDEVLLHLSYVVREQSQTLYGFLTVVDRDLFETITQISGIGPKTALGIISHQHLLQQAAEVNNASILAKIPGIGKKTAERLLMEMQGKLPALPGQTSVERDAVAALINLGYPQAKAQKVVGEVKEKDLSKLISAALGRLGKS